jgi:hypothetical protein
MDQEERQAMSVDRTESNALLAELAELQASFSFAEVWRDHIDRNGILCRVLHASRELMLVQRFGEDYVADGVSALRVADLTRVRTTSRELSAIPSIALSAKDRPAYSDSATLAVTAAVSVLAKGHGVIAVSMELCAPDILLVGEPQSVDDEWIVLNAWGTARSPDASRVLLRVSEITRVDAGTRYLQQLSTMRAALGPEPSLRVVK